MPSPAENAATVREALDTLYHYTSDQSNPPGNGRSETWAEGLAAVRALLAKAEAGAAAQLLLSEDILRVKAAEAERDAASEEATSYKAQLVQSLAREEQAVRERDQGQELAESLLLSVMADREGGMWLEDRLREIVAALTGEGTG